MNSLKRAQTDLGGQLVHPVGEDARAGSPQGRRADARFLRLEQPACSEPSFPRLADGRDRTAGPVIGSAAAHAGKAFRIEEKGLPSKRGRSGAPPWNGG